MIYVQMPNGMIQTYSGISTQLDYALQAGGVPIDQNGNPYSLTQFLPGFGEVPYGTPGAGYLAGDCPLNVINGEGYLPGQQEALQNAGKYCSPPSYGGCQTGFVGGGSRTGPTGNMVPNGGMVPASPEPEVVTRTDQARRLIDLSRRYPINSLSY